MIKYECAIFAGGCFWCMVKPFDKWKGVVKVISGYTGGHQENPTYQEVSSGLTGHTEAVKIIYDSKIITYNTLLDIFWSSMDPTDASGQFHDRGSQYRPEIFYTTKEQQKLAEKSKKSLDQSGRFSNPIVVPITKAGIFYPAEEYHQDFYKKNPEHYKRYSNASGRNEFIKKHR